MTVDNRNSFVNRDFLLLWFGSLAFGGSFQLLLTTLPIHAQALGASNSQVGLLIGLFSVSALVTRLPTGRLIDRGRRIPILIAGCAVFATSSVGYILAGSVALLLFVRLFHGSGMSLFTTAGQTLIVDIAPKSRRGEALGVYNVSTTLAAGFGPAIGVALVTAIGLTGMLGTSGLLAVSALVLVALVREPTRSSSPARPAKVFNRSVVGTSALLMAQMATYGVIAAFIPLLAANKGLENPGWFYLAYAATLLASQILAGGLSDRVGRLQVAVPGLVVSTIGLLAISASSGMWILAAGGIYGIGAGMVQPTLFAAAGDRVPAAERGSAMATMGLFLEIGIGGGAIVAGLVSDHIGLDLTFALAAVITATAAVAGGVAIIRSPKAA